MDGRSALLIGVEVAALGLTGAGGTGAVLGVSSDMINRAFRFYSAFMLAKTGVNSIHASWPW